MSCNKLGFKKRKRMRVKVEERTRLKVGNMLHRGDLGVAVQ